MRWHPVADSLPHQATEELSLEGFTIPKGTAFQGALASGLCGDHLMLICRILTVF